MKRAALDYGPKAHLARHDSWADFHKETARTEGRIVLFTTKGASSLYDFCFAPNDILLMGRESAGVPNDVHSAADARLFIPIQRDTRSLNVIAAAAIGLGEALRQTGGYDFQTP